MMPKMIAVVVNNAFPPYPWGHYAAHWVVFGAPQDNLKAFIRFQLDRIAEKERKK